MCAYKPLKKPIQWRLRPNERRLILLFGDFVAALLAMFIALYFWASGDSWLDFSMEFLAERPAFWFYLLPLAWLVLMTELYEIRRASRIDATIRGIAIAAGISLGIYFLVFFFAPPQQLPRRGFAFFIAAVAVLTLLWRFFYIQIFTAPVFSRRTVIVGAGRAGSTLAAILRQTWPPPFFLLGLIDDDPHKIGTEIEGSPVLGGCDHLNEVIKDQNISDIIVAISGKISPDLFEALTMAEEQGIEVTTMPVVYEEQLGRVPIFLLESDWMLRSFFDQAHASGFYEMAKRLLDIIGGLLGTVAFLIMLPFVSIATFLDSGRPIFYSQTRLGKRGRPYHIVKFRTMVQDAEKEGKAILATRNDQRVTRIGKILRKSHLDEFPQFVNVLRGEMSLVGPRAERPELVNDLQKEIPFYRGRLLVKPGVTGWAQINYGYASTTEQNGIKLEYDLYYIKKRSFVLDLIILIRTVGTVVGFRGQ